MWVPLQQCAPLPLVFSMAKRCTTVPSDLDHWCHKVSNIGALKTDEPQSLPLHGLQHDCIGDSNHCPNVLHAAIMLYTDALGS